MNIINPQTAIPSDLIGYFPTSCPNGWAEYTGARGRYIVGTPSGGDMAGTVGTAMTNKESRNTGQHTHTFSGSALATHTHTFAGSALANHAHTALAMNEAGDTISPLNRFTARSSTGDLNYKGNTPTVAMHSNMIVSTSAGTPAGTNAAISPGTPAGTNANTGAVANTNAPYIQLICCKKN